MRVYVLTCKEQVGYACATWNVASRTQPNIFGHAIHAALQGRSILFVGEGGRSEVAVYGLPQAWSMPFNGIGKIGQSAMEGIARQPEAAGNISTNMIISAALIEGAALFAIAVCGFIL